MIRTLLIGTILILSACVEAAPPSEEAQKAEQEARKVVARQYKGVDTDAMANCVQDNATEDEVTALSLGGLVARDAVSFIIARDETQSCLKDNNIVVAS